MNYDIKLPEPDITPVRSLAAAGATGQVFDWGHEYLRISDSYIYTRGEGAIVFVLDTAGETIHKDLIGNFKPYYSANFTADPMYDKFGHGVHVAGIIAAVDNGRGVIGVAPACKFGLVKVLNDEGGGFYSSIAAGIRFVADLELLPEDSGKRKIINMSFGSPRFSPTIHDALIYAAQKGCLLVAAAGNSYREGSDNTVIYPAKYPEVIAVSSITKAGLPSHFSSAGDEVFVAAPGSDVLSTYPEDRYVKMSGTSMASPYMAGILALLASKHPKLNQGGIMDLILNNATDIFEDGFDIRTGYGIVLPSEILGGKDEPDGPDPDPGSPDKEKPLGWIITIIILAVAFVTLVVLAATGII